MLVIGKTFDQILDDVSQILNPPFVDVFEEALVVVDDHFGIDLFFGHQFLRSVQPFGDDSFHFVEVLPSPNGSIQFLLKKFNF